MLLIECVRSHTEPHRDLWRVERSRKVKSMFASGLWFCSIFFFTSSTRAVSITRISPLGKIFLMANYCPIEVVLAQRACILEASHSQQSCLMDHSVRSTLRSSNDTLTSYRKAGKFTGHFFLTLPYVGFIYNAWPDFAHSERATKGPSIHHVCGILSSHQLGYITYTYAGRTRSQQSNHTTAGRSRLD